MTTARLGVLLSGRGSNFKALAEACAQGAVPAQIGLVVSNVPGAGGLDHARRVGLEAHAVPHAGLSRGAHERRVDELLRAHGIDWVCLAGYMRLLSPWFVDRWRWRILNIHPSLLPSFPGLHVHEQVLEYGARVSGCTVHLVDDGMDTGPVVIQRAVPVLDGDDSATLAGRVLEQEHRAYPEALRRLLVEPWEVVGRRLVFEESGAPAAVEDSSKNPLTADT